MFAGTGNAGTVATSGSAGWGRGSWLRRSSFAESRDTNRFRLSSKNWKLWRRLSRRLSNGERRRKVDHKGAATFNGVPGILARGGDRRLLQRALKPILELSSAVRSAGADRERQGEGEKSVPVVCDAVGDPTAVAGRGQPSQG